MASTEAHAHPLRSISSMPEPIERLGTLAKWVAGKCEELIQLDARVDRRLEHLTRTEENLRAVFESLRQQVTAAHDVAGDLKRLTEASPPAPAAADPQIDPAGIEDRLTKLARELETQFLQKAATADEDFAAAFVSATACIESAQANVTQRVAEAADSLDAKATALSQSFAEHLAARATEIEAGRPKPVIAQWREDADLAPSLALAEISADFERRASSMIESVRRAAVEQVERLSSQAAVAVEPILGRIERQREQIEAQLRAAMETSELALQRRVEELARAGDSVVDAVEQRLARRVQSARPRASESLDEIERSFQQRLAAMVDGARMTVASADEDFSRRIGQLRPRMAEMLQGVQDDLVEQLARLEEHAFCMTGWLERRLDERVETVISRSRAKLAAQQPAIAPQSAPAVAAALYDDEYAAVEPARPQSVEVELFVDSHRDRPHKLARVPAFD